MDLFISSIVERIDAKLCEGPQDGYILLLQYIVPIARVNRVT